MPDFEDNELNQQLLELAIAAQRAPSNSEARQTALTQLMNLIAQSGKLQQPHRTRFSQSNYEEIYAEARKDLFTYIHDGGIDKYDSQRGSVMAWVNNLMRYRVIDASRKIIGNHSGSRGEPYVSMHSLDQSTSQGRLEWEAQAVPVSTSDLMRKCLEEDRTGEFRRKHVENHPKASFQAIALSRLENESWKSISARLGVPVPTLSRFFERYKPRFISQFRAYGSDYSQLSLRELNDE
ncbi:sigma-70 family RNA polymerase sigma factor [Trichocoleus sp. FACHB-262]|uniref:sigma-70 family RNA polymerase sigma factor n=1 Tax=Trichocoleus sp. FACHB-262 TaxID=2692869 RepID=UPI001684422D|nr:sigma-70 family RNA polymerase sigma factor [Trichocoleus sp. FACHB-262]MBD2121872.1 sigma-70 family RNA polymerase sigma factor [Trichocoleus sp. FACHB-262]